MALRLFHIYFTTTSMYNSCYAKDPLRNNAEKEAAATVFTSRTIHIFNKRGA